MPLAVKLKRRVVSNSRFYPGAPASLPASNWKFDGNDDLQIAEGDAGVLRMRGSPKSESLRGADRTIS